MTAQFGRTPQMTKPLAPRPKADDPNSRSSAYNMYDNYLDDDAKRQSGAAALGMLMSGAMDDSDSDDDDIPPPRYNVHTPPASPPSEKKKKQDPFADPAGTLHVQNQHQHQPIPLAAPKPGYVAPVTQFSLKSPPPAAMRSPQPEMHRQQPQIQMPMPSPSQAQFASAIPRSPTSVPSTPHPLPALSPITPVFARPAKPQSDDGVKFDEKAIIRGNGEETLIPRRGEKGDDFWRRFSMVVKEEAHKKDKESSWLKKTRSGHSHFSRWVWVIGLLLLAAVVGAIALGWYVSHNDPSHVAPKAIGGSADEHSATSSAAATTSGVLAASSSPHVSPTKTVEKRAAEAFPTGAVQKHRRHAEHLSRLSLD
ncbi:hypothetical protein PUNSTDRAFT_49829 [Punctularia strigosozonata HHB-11173 SS5]|uniref:uncharacterized protein n=1 Tax=Punctularia strigosozonata (strain HHB-11173) TaxID=741275 RepID=UPI0004416760|nr:uncharacterized protein PUNSTDRAFT_49829 [Punctularia strigosozonata HHB-11173 SS5]EIN12534.1 hypothetical protein PUNSTDRAFT_49829 [Punctularia strigosozonata HHB-11173 SS5]